MEKSVKETAYNTSVFSAAGSAMMSFKPVNAIHQHLCAFHTYAIDRTRHIEAHHFCTHLTPDLHQCVIYDSDKPDAKLIGIEYILSENAFLDLPLEERKYWHSHKYEVESGLLRLTVKGLVPGKDSYPSSKTTRNLMSYFLEMVTDYAEQPAMLSLQRTYGKTIHTWQVDIHPHLPLGPPTLMMSYTNDRQLEKDPKLASVLISQEIQSKRLLRKNYLPQYGKSSQADEWEQTGQSVSFEPIMKDVQFQ
ncbi:hypothetical protein Clacol_006288 [Clathrus columnatus]|uniref:DUF1264 domain-containing protein n=1 Tax=Clathrus columnatus TaxID=1419009 RepID=A0AAV5ABM9_9AGAM|nr:hypothetical protein Clacol_006288 [Clathrus columnatus]